MKTHTNHVCFILKVLKLIHSKPLRLSPIQYLSQNVFHIQFFELHFYRHQFRKAVAYPPMLVEKLLVSETYESMQYFCQKCYLLLRFYF